MGVMSTTTWNTEVCGLTDGRNSTDGGTLTTCGLDAAAAKSIPLAPKSIPMAPVVEVSGPTPVSMASAAQVMTLQSDGIFVEGSRECCPDGSVEAAIWDIGGKNGTATPLSTARLLLTTRYLQLCLIIDRLDLGILRHVL